MVWAVLAAIAFVIVKAQWLEGDFALWLLGILLAVTGAFLATWAIGLEGVAGTVVVFLGLVGGLLAAIAPGLQAVRPPPPGEELPSGVESLPARSGDPVPTPKGLAAALLRLEDVPAGWSPAPLRGSEGLQGYEFCGVKPELAEVREKVAAEYKFGRTEQELLPHPRTTHALTRMSHAEAASNVVAGISHAGRKCQTYEKTELGGLLQTRWNISPISSPWPDQQSTAFQLTGTLQGGLPVKVKINVAIAQDGAIVNTLEYGGPSDEVDDTLWRQLAERARGRLRALKR